MLLVAGPVHAASAEDAASQCAPEASFEALGDLPGGETRRRGLDVSADGAVVVGSAHGPDGEEAVVWGGRQGARSVRALLVETGLDLTGRVLTEASAVADDGRTLTGTSRDPQGRTQARRARAASVSGRDSSRLFCTYRSIKSADTGTSG